MTHPTSRDPAENGHPERLGRFRIERRLGGGGMATVWLAREDPGDRLVALKVMQTHLAGDPEFVRRFVQEVKATLGMRHPHVVEVLDYGEEAGKHWMAAEYVDGGDCEELLQRLGKLPAPLAVELVAQLLEGLSCAHARGVIHRDVKPANLMLSRAGLAKIGDFGIAKTVDGSALTQTGLLIGTPAYMSPEQALGQAIDPRTDVWAAGVVLYELLSGKSPFLADSMGATVARLLKGPARTIYELEPTVPAAVEAAVEGMLTVDPAKRFAGTAEALAALEGYRIDLQARFPSLVADAVADPAGTRRRLDAEASARALATAKELLGRGAGERRAAALALHKALLLDSSSGEAARLLGELSTTETLRLEGVSTPKIAELEAALEKSPETAALLSQLAQLHRMEGSLHRAVAYYKRYLRLRPADVYVAGQLAQLTGERMQLRPAQAQAAGTGGKETGYVQAPGRSGTPTIQVQAPLVPGGRAAAAPALPGSLSPVEAPAPQRRGSALTVLAVVAAALLVLGLVRGASWLRARSDESADAMRAAQAAADDARRRIEEEEHARAGQQEAREDAARAAQLLERGMSAFRSGQHDTALRLFTTVARQWPQLPEGVTAELRLGHTLLAAGRAAEARSVLTTFLEAHAGSPQAAEALLGRGFAALRLGDAAAAEQDLSRLLREHAGSPLTLEATLVRAEAWTALGKHEDARADLTRVTEQAGPSDLLGKRARELLAELPP